MSANEWIFAGEVSSWMGNWSPAKSIRGNKMNKLTIDEINLYKDYLAKAGRLEDKIYKRIDYILKRCFAEIGKELKDGDWWFYSDDCAPISKHIGKYVSGFEFHKYSPDNSPILIDRDGNIVEITDGFPSRWLTEDFEEELVRGVELYRKQQEEIKRKAAEESDKLKNSLKAKALAKLTAAEKRVLGL